MISWYLSIEKEGEIGKKLDAINIIIINAMDYNTEKTYYKDFVIFNQF